MASGLPIFNGRSEIQIDSDLVNFVFIQKGTVTIPAGGYINSFPAAQIVLNGVTPILCLRPVNSWAGVVNTKIINGQYFYRIDTERGETSRGFMEGGRITANGMVGGAFPYMNVGGNMSLGESYFGSQVLLVNVAGL